MFLNNFLLLNHDLPYICKIHISTLIHSFFFHQYKNMEGLLKTCDICYKDLTSKVSLDCGHELCVMCFLEIMGMTRTFKCHMCRKQYDWKKEGHKETCIFSPEETLSLLIREDDNQFRTLIGMETSRAFEVIVSLNNNSFVSIPEQHIIQFIIVLGRQMDVETLKFLISEFVANNVPFPLSSHMMTLYKACGVQQLSVILKTLGVIWKRSTITLS